MSRNITLIVLAAIVLIFGVLVYRVLAGFLLPVFMALLLQVIFRPLQSWIVARCHGRDRLAAGLTTLVIMLIVLGPLLAILARATTEAVTVVQNLDVKKIDQEQVTTWVADLTDRFGLSLDASDVQSTVVGKVRELLEPLALSTPQFLGGLLMGLFVMIVSLYYFLADGPEMMQSVLRLSPLDDRYKQQLVDEFGAITCAVVVATLLSAVLQGLFAGVGYYFAGLGSLFLLTLLTMLLSLVPFIGAASVWVPCCLWLFFHDGKTVPAIILVVYCIAIVGMVDNVIKPMVLHGRSNLHPLLALLSVIGGTEALGPIGILVGPMVVAFLQVALNMFSRELNQLSHRQGSQNLPTI